MTQASKQASKQKDSVANLAQIKSFFVFNFTEPAYAKALAGF